MLWRLEQMWGRWSERDCLHTRHSASRELESRALLTSVTMSPVTWVTWVTASVMSVTFIRANIQIITRG